MRPSPYPAAAVPAPTAPMHPPPDHRQANTAQQPFFKYGGDAGRRESVSTPYDGEPSSAAGTLVDWNEEVVDEYAVPCPLNPPLLLT